MLLVGEMFQRVQSLYSGGVQSKDTRLTNRHIYSALITGRSILLSQQVNKRQIINQWAYQLLPCVELHEVAATECPCSVPIGCTIVRSKHKIPKPVSGVDKHIIQFVSSPDGSTRYDETSFIKSKYNKGRKFTSNKPGYFFHNGYLYITVYKKVAAVTVSGVFDDILEAYTFPSCNKCEECECKDYEDYEFPFDGDLVRPLLELANQELISLFKQMGRDDFADAVDSTKVGMIHQQQQQ